MSSDPYTTAVQRSWGLAAEASNFGVGSKVSVGLQGLRFSV